jgi:hypothetical protein
MGRIPSRRLVAAGVLAALAGGVLAVAVAAHTTHYGSSLAINAFTSGTMDNYFYGVVNSPSSRCVVGRKVSVYRRQPGRDEKLGSDVSQQASTVGPYTVTSPSGDLIPGSYYSQTRKRDLKPGRRHAHICRAATSSPLDVGP